MSRFINLIKEFAPEIGEDDTSIRGSLMKIFQTVSDLNKNEDDTIGTINVSKVDDDENQICLELPSARIYLTINVEPLEEEENALAINPAETAAGLTGLKSKEPPLIAAQRIAKEWVLAAVNALRKSKVGLEKAAAETI
jgi:hypothetical protein